MNLSRVIGPAIGGVPFAAFGPTWVFLGNAVSYLFVSPPSSGCTCRPLSARRHRGGTRVSAASRAGSASPAATRSSGAPLDHRSPTFSSLCLLWVGQFPVFAAREPRPRRGVARLRPAVRLLRARRRRRLDLDRHGLRHVVEGDARAPGAARLRRSCLAVYALLRTPAPGVPGRRRSSAPAYFGTITALNTAMQARLANHERGRVMALWMMGFGGAVVSVANLVLRAAGRRRRHAAADARRRRRRRRARPGTPTSAHRARPTPRRRRPPLAD